MSTLFVYVLECEGAVRVHTCGMQPDAQARGLNVENRQYQNKDFGVSGSFFFFYSDLRAVFPPHEVREELHPTHRQRLNPLAASMRFGISVFYVLRVTHAAPDGNKCCQKYQYIYIH